MDDNSEKFKLLIIEDDLLTRNSLSKSLSYLGFEVHDYSNGYEAIMDIKAGIIPEVILSDIHMPKLDGIKFAKLLNEFNIDVPIIYITAYSDNDEYISESINLTNIKGIVEKPVLDIELLANNIKSVILENKKNNIERETFLISANVDLKGNITFISKAYCDISEYSKEEIYGKNISFLKSYLEDSEIYTNSMFFEEIFFKLKEQKTVETEIECLSKSGYNYWLDATIQKTFNAKGEHLGYELFAKDISAKKYHELTLNQINDEKIKELEQTKEKLSIYNEELNAQNQELEETQIELEKTLNSFGSFFDYSPIPYITINKKLELINFNKCAQNTFHITPYMPHTSILKYMNKNSFYELMKSDLLNDKDSEEILLEMRISENEYRRYNVTIFNNPNNTNEYLLTFIDSEKELIYTEIIETQVEEQLKEINTKDYQLMQQSKMNSIGELIGNISHQWKQPLSLISVITTSILYQMKHGNYDINELENELLTIDEQVRYLAETIDTLNNIRKNEKLAIKVPLNEKIKDICKLAETKIKNSNIKLEYYFSEPDQEIRYYKGELTEVILNIVNNAKGQLEIKNVENPFIKIFTEFTDETAIIKIKDNAGGIPGDIISKIFEPYFTTKEENNGTGLGLHMCYKIITESFGGHISVSNIDDGCEFRIEIPKVAITIND